MQLRRTDPKQILMNIYQKVNSQRKMLLLLEKQYVKDNKKFLERYEAKKYRDMPFKPGTMLTAENNLMKLAGSIRELRTDLNRLVQQTGDKKVIDWYNETNEDYLVEEL